MPSIDIVTFDVFRNKEQTLHITIDKTHVLLTVKFLDLSFNNISELTARLHRIERLLLSHNEITELQQFLFNDTKHLIELDVSFNQLRE